MSQDSPVFHDNHLIGDDTCRSQSTVSAGLANRFHAKVLCTNHTIIFFFKVFHPMDLRFALGLQDHIHKLTCKMQVAPHVVRETLFTVQSWCVLF